MNKIETFLDMESIRLYVINALALSVSLTNIHMIISIMLMGASFVYTMLKVLQMIEAKGKDYKVSKRAKRIKKAKKK
jgi:hypothetical protein